MNKIAQGALAFCQGTAVGEFLVDFDKLAEEKFTRSERRNIRAVARQLDRTPDEVESVAGRGLTPGQIKRRVGIGTGLIMGTGLVRRVIKDPGALKQGIKGVGRLLSPRDLAADVAMGGTFYGLAPGAIRAADLEAAKKRRF
jgi:hypothetical protein